MIFVFSVLGAEKRLLNNPNKYSKFDIQTYLYSRIHLWDTKDIKTKKEISSKFLAFSEYMNFTTVNAATAIFASFEFLGACPACRSSLWGKKVIVVFNFKLVLAGSFDVKKYFAQPIQTERLCSVSAKITFYWCYLVFLV